MTNQVEVKEQVRWEDLEVDEEPKYFEGLGDAAAEMHQFICEEISRRKDGNEPLSDLEKSEALRKHLISVEDCVPQKGSWIIDDSHEDVECDIDLAKPGSEFTALVESARPFAMGTAIMQGVLLVFGITAEQFAEAMEGRARAALELELDYLNTPVLGAVDWREANKRLPRISEMVARINALCTPSRVSLTGDR